MLLREPEYFFALGHHFVTEVHGPSLKAGPIRHAILFAQSDSLSQGLNGVKAAGPHRPTPLDKPEAGLMVRVRAPGIYPLRSTPKIVTGIQGF
jgi:hypothetical protein